MSLNKKRGRHEATAIDGKKRCCECCNDKPLAQYGLHKGSPDGRQYKCRECRNTWQRERRSKMTKEQKRVVSYSTHLRRRYGIDLPTLETMIDKQEGRCLICDELPTESQRRLRWGAKGLNVDHNHETGEVRGLLCTPCNLMLGGAKDRPEILRKAADYLVRFGS